MSVNEKMTAIADAIRSKTNGKDSLTLEQMAQRIGEIKAEPTWVPYLSNLTNAFNGVELPENTELDIHIPNFGGNIRETFQNCKNLISVKLSNDNYISSLGMDMSGAFRYNSYIKKIDISGLTCPLREAYMAFGACYVLEEIIGE